MGKRSAFERVPRDFYPTPFEAVAPLLPHLLEGTHFIEPCAGSGHLIMHLEAAGHTCEGAFDIHPQDGLDGIGYGDATTRDVRTMCGSCVITNPPWSRDILHPIIENLSRQLPTWLLFDADWMHTRQSADLIRHCRRIVSVGRVKWIPDSPFTGKDNCCWYLFDQSSDAPAHFTGRVTRVA